MTTEGQARFEAAHRLFLEADELEGAELEAFLTRACGGDAELQREVLALLAEARAGDRRLERPASAALLDAEHGRLPEAIGEFRIRGVLGTGGAGIVYEAEQAHPRRAVALKLIRSPFASDEERRRFEHEGQVLAWLNHPGIAAVYATGSADAGLGLQPYLAMELVRGLRLDAYAAQHALSAPARLELLARVCDAVHHAHQKGVIHRDLKPGNILVDARGQPKVLDFGVARITNADMDVSTRHTGAGEILGTLPYMSPEQVEADPARLDLRSDVYALGVIAYELLSGQRPHEVASSTVPAAIRAIVHDEPTNLGALDRRLRGDVANIVHRALEKEKERRYGSAAELAADIRRFLANEPIQARPASRAYQFRRFAQRNRVLVGGIAAVFVVLLAGAITSTLLYFEKEDQRAAAEGRGRELELALAQAQQNLERALDAEKAAHAQEARATTEANTAKAVTDYLISLFEYADPEQANPGDVTALDLLDRGVERIRGQFADQPEVRARLLNVFGKIDIWLQRFDRAGPILDEALALEAELHTEDSAEYADTLERVAKVHLEAGDAAGAEEMQRRVLALREKHLGKDDQLYGDALNNLANSLMERGEYAESERLLTETRALRVATYGEGHHEVATVDYQFAMLYSLEGRHAEAVPRLESALAGLQAFYGDDHWRTLMTRSALAGELGPERAAEAREHARVAYEGMRRLFGEESLLTTRTLKIYATTLAASGQPEETVRILEDLLARQEGLPGRDAERASLLTILANHVGDLGRADEAEALYLEALDLHRRMGGSARMEVLTVQHRLAALYLQTGRLEEALELEREVVRQHGALHDLATPDARHALDVLAEIYRGLKRPADEEDVRKRKLEAVERELGQESREARSAREELAEFLRRNGREAEVQGLAGSGH